MKRIVRRRNRNAVVGLTRQARSLLLMKNNNGNSPLLDHNDNNVQQNLDGSCDSIVSLSMTEEEDDEDDFLQDTAKTPRMRNPTASSTSATTASTMRSHNYDLEAGCPTKEEPSKSHYTATTNNNNKVTFSSSHKKHDDQEDVQLMSSWKRRLVSVSGWWRPFAAKPIPSRVLHFVHTAWNAVQQVVQGIPLLLRIMLVVHLATCLYTLSIVWKFHLQVCGIWCGWFSCTLVAASMMATTGTAIASTRAAHQEMDDMMETEGKSRAILNTLYPNSVLQQMYLELQPHQIAAAQEQIQHELSEQKYQDQVWNEIMEQHGDGAVKEQEQEQGMQESQQDEEEEASTTVVDPQSLGYEDDDNITTTSTNASHCSSHDSHDSSNPSSPMPPSNRKRTVAPTIQKIRRTRSDNPTKLYAKLHASTGNLNLVVTDNAPPQNNHSTHNTYSNANNTNDDTIMCLRRNSLTLRRQSISRRATMGHSSSGMGVTSMTRRCSIRSPHRSTSAMRRRSSMGSVSSNTSIGTSTGRPIQERFAATTVLFADIAGFTRWCSEREPCHVFSLLEAIFFVFDELARRGGVYKIETIGDCYVAVTGIPHRQDDHAVIMAQFACRIVQEFDTVVAGLMEELGPDTATLQLRAGCHSGPVTAGVLRGDKGRFQLFGDTVNTAARMESNGLPGKVQISEAMARYLALEGKSHWYHPRQDKISAKGKGLLATFWLEETLAATPLQQQQLQQQNLQEQQLTLTPKITMSIWMPLNDVIIMQEQRLEEWNYHQLELLVKKIVYQTQAQDGNDQVGVDWEDFLQYEEHDGSILEELNAKAAFGLPAILSHSEDSENKIDTISKEDLDTIVLPAKVVLELQGFVKAITANFQKNPFHCFQHACHVVHSMIQLLDHLLKTCPALKRDPLAQFVIVLTCLVHDVDNPGVTNEQLMQEDADMAEYFSNTCLTQQNALDVAWELLVGDTCQHLLKAICSHSMLELDRFRKYMVHAMLATDVEDRDLRLERRNRWKNSDNSTPCEQSIVVIEQFMQLSNLIHNVQTEQFFNQWTERYFREQYLAYIRGRREADPCLTFYEEQLDILRKDIVPQAERFVGADGTRAKRNASNGILGSCKELLHRAKENARAWESQGNERIKGMATSAKYEFGEKQSS